MNLETLREYCLAKKGTTEHFPFDESTLVLKAGDKMYLLVDIYSNPLSFNLKCDPERAVNLQERYPSAVLPGYHMNKKHWNTVVANGVLSMAQLCELIDHSYDLIINSLPKKKRMESGL